MGGSGCLLLDNLEDLLEARLETVGGDTREETPAIKASLEASSAEWGCEPLFQLRRCYSSFRRFGNSRNAAVSAQGRDRTRAHRLSPAARILFENIFQLSHTIAGLSLKSRFMVRSGSSPRCGVDVQPRFLRIDEKVGGRHGVHKSLSQKLHASLWSPRRQSVSQSQPSGRSCPLLNHRW